MPCRGVIEAWLEKLVGNYRLMDDDILIDFRMFEELISFISLLKEEYRNYFIAGGMCSLDFPFLQYEKYASWKGDHFVQSGPSYDLRDINTIITNEREDRETYRTAGWWFCCFSADIIRMNNYPFPCFFRGDDMEFSIRNGSNIITLNGINVWHEPFYKKYTISSESYYLTRNTLIINSLYLKSMSAKQNIKYVWKKFIRAILTFDYDSAELLIKAMEDFQKGVSFLENIDPEEYNQLIMKKNHKKISIDSAINDYRFDDINYEIYNKTDRGIRCLLRRITFNGFIFPGFMLRPFGFALEGFGARYINYYKVKTVFVFDPFTRTGYFLTRNRAKAMRLLNDFWSEKRKFVKNYRRICDDYSMNFWKLQTETFWRNILEVSV